MSEQGGRVLIASDAGQYVLRLEGDVRLTLCTAVDEQVGRICADPELSSVVADVSDAKGVDSTTLGLLAKLALGIKSQHGMKLVVYSANPAITRLLTSMCLQQVVDLREEPMPMPVAGGHSLCAAADEAAMKGTIMEAHQVLMDLSPHNEERFKGLMDSLKAS